MVEEEAGDGPLDRAKRLPRDREPVADREDAQILGAQAGAFALLLNRKSGRGPGHGKTGQAGQNQNRREYSNHRRIMPANKKPGEMNRPA
jgi:hypothetical protein